MERAQSRPVVVVADSAPLRERLAKALAAGGYGAVEAADAQRARVAIVAASRRGVVASPGAAQLSLIAVVSTGEDSRPDGADDFIREEAIETELVERVRRVDLMHAAKLQAQEQQRQMGLLLMLTSAYAESLDVEALLHGVTQRLASELGVERASLIVVDGSGEAGYIMAASDDAALKGLRIDLGRYPEIREVLRTGKPVIIEDAPTHPLLEGVKAQVAATGIRNIAALPLAIGGVVLGVLLARASEKRGVFRAREIDFLATVAHATAVALRNARQFETIRGESEREKTARIAAEERAEHLLRYQAYFAHLSHGTAILDRNGCVLAINTSGLKLLGVVAQDARGRPFHDLALTTADGSLRELIGCMLRGETCSERDVRLRTLTGQSCTFSIAGAPLSEGAAAGLLTFRDVTQARHLAAELRHTKDFLEQLIDSSVDAIIAADMKGKIILFNKGAEAISGFTGVEARERMNVRDLYPPGGARRVMALLRSPEGGGRGRLNLVRQEILTQSGEVIPVSMTASILYEGERELATVGIFTDLRDRMQLERKLSDVQTRLVESEKSAAIVALAGAAAHELNQPLTSVMGYAELLRRKLTAADFAHRPVDIIYREAERMAEIVRKIGKITRYETRAYVGDAQILDLDKASSNEK